MSRKNYVLDQKKPRKKGIFGLFPHYSRKTLRNFSVLIRLCSNSQDSCPFGYRRCDNNKKGKVNQKKNCVSSQKPSKNPVFHHFFVSNLGPSNQNMGFLSTILMCSHKSIYKMVSTPFFLTTFRLLVEKYGSPEIFQKFTRVSICHRLGAKKQEFFFDARKIGYADPSTIQ